METTLDDFIDTLNSRSYEDLCKYIPIYDVALQNAYHLFGEYCFRKVVPETVGEKRTTVNKLLMLTLSIL